LPAWRETGRRDDGDKLHDEKRQLESAQKTRKGPRSILLPLRNSSGILSEKDVLALKVVMLRKEISSRAKWRQTISVCII
jgi:hypothetical protein